MFKCHKKDVIPEVRESFRPRMLPGMTAEEKEALNVEYRAALKKAEKQADKDFSAVIQARREAFKADPVGILALIFELFPYQGYTKAERVLMFGLADSKAKRTGKGFLVCKKTLAEGTISPYEVTVQILGKTFVYQTNSRNDKRDRERTAACGVSMALQELGLD